MPSPWRRWLRGSAVALALLIAVPMAMVALHLALMFLRPVHDVLVPLPIESAVAHVEVWGNTTSDGRFELRVENHNGEARHMLWEDWGPAKRVSLYLTPKGWLVALGGGGMAEMFELRPELPPRWVDDSEQPITDGADWTYIGVVDRSDDGLRFYSPSEQQECVPTYLDERDAFYRPAYQAETC